MYPNKYNIVIAIFWLLVAMYTTVFVGPGHASPIRVGIGNFLMYVVSFVFFYIYIYIENS